jgi:hypothetical protein
VRPRLGGQSRKSGQRVEAAWRDNFPTRLQEGAGLYAAGDGADLAVGGRLGLLVAKRFCQLLNSGRALVDVRELLNRIGHSALQKSRDI